MIPEHYTIDLEELHALFVARCLMHYKWYVAELEMNHKPREAWTEHLEASELMARVIYRLDQRWFRSMIWETEM